MLLLFPSLSFHRLPAAVYLLKYCSPLTITHYSVPHRLNSVVHNMIFRAAPPTLYAIIAFLFVLPVVQVAGEVDYSVSRYIKLFPRLPSQAQRNRRSQTRRYPPSVLNNATPRIEKCEQWMTNTLRTRLRIWLRA